MFVVTRCYGPKCAAYKPAAGISITRRISWVHIGASLISKHRGEMAGKKEEEEEEEKEDNVISFLDSVHDSTTFGNQTPLAFFCV